MGRSASYYQVDSFTAKPFDGLPVTVLTHVTGLSDIEMQNIASEFNCGNTVFLMPSFELAKAHYRLRHFNQKQEVPVDFRNILASLWVLVQEEVLPIPIDGSLFYKIGETPGDSIVSEIRCSGGKVDRILYGFPVPTMSVSQKSLTTRVEYIFKTMEERPPEISRAIMISLDRRCVYVAVDGQTLLNFQPGSAIVHQFQSNEKLDLSLIAVDREEREAHVYQRTFRASNGQVTDTVDCNDATVAALFYLQEKPVSNGMCHVKVHQVNARGRWCEIYCELTVRNRSVISCKLGGNAVIVGSGKIIIE